MATLSRGISIEQMRKCARMRSKSSIREVAKRASVWLGTVSNVLNRPEIVAEETRERVKSAIEEIGFVRNGSARHFRAGPRQHIRLIPAGGGNPILPAVHPDV